MSSKRRNLVLAQLARSHHAAASNTEDAIFYFLSSLDTPKSLAIWLLFKNKEHQQLVDIDISPLDYNDPLKFRDDYTAWSFLTKSDFLKLDVSKEDQAFKKFFKFEDLCSRTNRRFKSLSFDPSYKGSNVWLLNATIRKIEGILGDYSAEEFVDNANWGPGVTTKLHGCDVSAVNKFHSENGITRDLYSLVSPWFSKAYPLWSAHLLKDVSVESGCFDYQIGNKIVTVPKNSKTDRVIAIEPGLNLWFQKSLGTMIRRRLGRQGIDLNSQENNQHMARQASKDALHATVDFSSASDSISLELVRELLPPRWFQLLNATRSPLGIHNERLVRWEKFSSMGNGFTFELESLIFYAAAQAVAEYLHEDGEISVFGDDVIIPVACYDLFSSFSEFLGFTVNTDKSFSSSYFRESCGAHFFDGVDCKPIFLKEKLQNVQAIYKLANGVRRLSHRRNNYYGCDLRFRTLWYRLFSWTPKPLRFRISNGLGDSGFVVNFDEATPSLARHGIEGYLVEGLVEAGVTRCFEGDGLLIARLMVRHPEALFTQKRISYAPEWGKRVRDSEWSRCQGVPLLTQGYGNNYTLRGRTKLRVIRMLVPLWYNMGCWI